MTAVEWLVNELKCIKSECGNQTVKIEIKGKLLKQAKEMEEQQKVEFAFRAYSEMLSTGKDFVDIVNSMRTFKSE